MSEFLQFHLVNSDPGITLDLVSGVNSLGRAEDNRCVISDDSISSHHGFLDVSDERVVLHDLGSTNGTYVDGRQVVEAVVVAGQLLKFGSVEFRLEARTVRISIPAASPRGEELFPVFDDGSPACYRHQMALAIAQCQQCSRTYCGDCVKSLKLKVGNAVYLCPDCSGRCSFLEPTPPAKGRAANLLSKIASAFRGRK